MKKLSCALLAALALTTGTAFAGSLSGTADFTSNYVFRGITYSHDKPAVQAGAEYDWDNGLYAGTWGSSVNHDDLGPSNAAMELDTYAGYRGKINDDLSYDAGILRFNYPGADALTSSGKHIDTDEGYLSASWKWLNVKYSQELNDYFGVENAAANTKGSHYLEVNGNFNLPDQFSLNLHAGHQTIKNGTAIYGADPSFTDYKVAVNRDLGAGWLASVAYTHTNANAALYTVKSGSNTQNLAKSHVFATITRNF